MRRWKSATTAAGFLRRAPPHRFHLERAAPGGEAAETARLLVLADDLHLERGLDPAELMPYRVALEALALWAYARRPHQR